MASDTELQMDHTPHVPSQIDIMLSMLQDQQSSDHLGLEGDPSIKDLFRQTAQEWNDDTPERVIFSEMVTKMNHRGKQQQRVLLLSNKSLYNIVPTTLSMPRRRIPVGKIGAVTLSETTDDFVVHVKDEHDYWYRCQRRHEFIRVLAKICREYASNELSAKLEPLQNLPKVAITKAHLKKRREAGKYSAGHMTKKVRELVSKKKVRFKEDGFDLDLTYITDQIIAMGVPSEGAEGVFRNPMAEVYDFLEQRHHNAYKVYNLCSERKYDPAVFHNRVSEFGFDDHNVPSLKLILEFCEDVSTYLELEPNGLAAVHCKAGKGRTGVMISSWFVYSEQFATAKESLEEFAVKRTHNSKGVTIPSQLRYVYYFEQLLNEYIRAGKPFDWRGEPLVLTQIKLHTIPRFSMDGSCSPYFTLEDVEHNQLFDSRKISKPDKYNPKETDVIVMNVSVRIQGDIKMRFYHEDKSMFHSWFNTSFIPGLHLELPKTELDKAVKDTSHKKFDEDFKLELFFRHDDIKRNMLIAEDEKALEALDSGMSSADEMDIVSGTRIERRGSTNSILSDEEKREPIGPQIAYTAEKIHQQINDLNTLLTQEKQNVEILASQLQNVLQKYTDLHMEHFSYPPPHPGKTLEKCMVENRIIINGTDWSLDYSMSQEEPNPFVPNGISTSPSILERPSSSHHITSNGISYQERTERKESYDTTSSSDVPPLSRVPTSLTPIPSGQKRKDERPRNKSPKPKEQILVREIDSPKSESHKSIKRKKQKRGRFNKENAPPMPNTSPPKAPAKRQIQQFERAASARALPQTHYVSPNSSEPTSPRDRAVSQRGASPPPQPFSKETESTSKKKRSRTRSRSLGTLIRRRIDNLRISIDHSEPPHPLLEESPSVSTKIAPGWARWRGASDGKYHDSWGKNSSRKSSRARLPSRVFSSPAKFDHGDDEIYNISLPDQSNVKPTLEILEQKLEQKLLPIVRLNDKSESMSYSSSSGYNSEDTNSSANGSASNSTSTGGSSSKIVLHHPDSAMNGGTGIHTRRRSSSLPLPVLPNQQNTDQNIKSQRRGDNSLVPATSLYAQTGRQRQISHASMYPTEDGY